MKTYTPEEIEAGRNCFNTFRTNVAPVDAVDVSWDVLTKYRKAAWIEAAKACQPEGESLELYAVQKLNKNDAEWYDAEAGMNYDRAVKLIRTYRQANPERKYRLIKLVTYQTVVKE